MPGLSPFQSGRITTIHLPESVTRRVVARLLACTFGALFARVSLTVRRQSIQFLIRIIVKIDRLSNRLVW